jgi:hypothetical protein
MEGTAISEGLDALDCSGIRSGLQWMVIEVVESIHLPQHKDLKLPVDLHITWEKEVGKETPRPYLVCLAFRFREMNFEELLYTMVG